MPSRLASLFIVLFWLLTASWYVRRELVPWFGSDRPPVVPIDVAEEATRSVIQTRWGLYRDGNRWGTVTTTLLSHDEDGTYEQASQVRGLDLIKFPGFVVTVDRLMNAYRVTRDGELRGLRCEAELVFNKETIRAGVEAEVANGELHRQARVETGGTVIKVPLEPVASTGGSVLNPMHPVNRIKGLRPNQTWLQPTVDPLGDTVQAAVKAFATKFLGPNAALPLPAARVPKPLTARVLPDVEMRDFEGRSQAFYVIEYRGDDLVARTYVRQWDGLVVRQEATGRGETLVLERESQ